MIHWKPERNRQPWEEDWSQRDAGAYVGWVVASEDDEPPRTDGTLRSRDVVPRGEPPKSCDVASLREMACG